MDNNQFASMAAVSSPNPQPQQNIESKYLVGQSKSIHDHLSQRTAQNCAAFLLPHIKPTDKILDVGCGPGSITIDLAALVPQGSCIGLDAADEALKTARESAEKRGLKNIKFVLGDGGKLPFDDNTFDIVYSHQILVHTPHPITIISEIHRVLKPNGIYATREADITTLKIIPDILGCRKSYELMGRTLERNGSNPKAGQVNDEWCVEAGFGREGLRKTWSWMEVDHMDLESSARMVRKIGKGLVTDEEIEEMAEAWKVFEEVPKGEKSFALKCGEVLCRK